MPIMLTDVISTMIIFSHTPDEAMSGGLAKACVPGKKYSVPEKIEFLNNKGSSISYLPKPIP